MECSFRASTSYAFGPREGGDDAGEGVGVAGEVGCARAEWVWAKRARELGTLAA